MVSMNSSTIFCRAPSLTGKAFEEKGPVIPEDLRQHNDLQQFNSVFPAISKVVQIDNGLVLPIFQPPG